MFDNAAPCVSWLFLNSPNIVYIDVTVGELLNLFMRHKNQISLKVESSVSGEQKDHFESCKFGFVTSDVWIRIDGSTDTQNSNRKSGNLRSKKLFTFFEKLRKIDNNINVYVLMCITLYSTYPDYLIKINKPHIRKSQTQRKLTRQKIVILYPIIRFKVKVHSGLTWVLQSGVWLCRESFNFILLQTLNKLMIIE